MKPDRIEKKLKKLDKAEKKWKKMIAEVQDDPALKQAFEASLKMVQETRKLLETKLPQ